MAQDHADGQPEEVEDRAHPLRVAAGEVVVDRDDVDALAGDRVQDRCERRDEGLALAGAHLGDLALVEHDRADELLVEVAHAEGADHRLAGHREHVRQDVVQRVPDRLVVALPPRLGQLAPALEVGVVELVLGRLLGDDGLAELVAERREPLADLRVAQRLDLFLEIVGLVDERLDPLQLTVVRIDEPGKEIEHGPRSIGGSPRRPSATRTHAQCGGTFVCRAAHRCTIHGWNAEPSPRSAVGTRIQRRGLVRVAHRPAMPGIHPGLNVAPDMSSASART